MFEKSKLTNQVMIIVDPYSSGKLLASFAAEKGIRCVHVQSEMDHPFAQSVQASDFIDHLTFDGDFESLVGYLARFNLCAVVAGAETGVLLADRICAHFKLPGNDARWTNHRRDKYLMNERLRSVGIRAVKQIKSNSIGDILQWVNEHNLFPIVVKPLNSAGSDNVTICSNKEEVEAAFTAIIGNKNKLGYLNENVLAQELLVGQDYVVDCVSHEGQHYVTNIWKYAKIKEGARSFIYDCAALLPYEGTEQELLVSYVCCVLDALGIKNGPAHCEVIFTGDGPVLVETGARLHGCYVPAVNGLCTGVNQAELTVDALLDGQSFLEKTSVPYKVKKNLFVVDLISTVNGYLSDEGLRLIRELPSFHNIYMNVENDKKVYKTVDLFTSPGSVELVNFDPEMLRADYRRIRELEANILYQDAT